MVFLGGVWVPGSLAVPDDATRGKSPPMLRAPEVSTSLMRRCVAGRSTQSRPNAVHWWSQLRRHPSLPFLLTHASEELPPASALTVAVCCPLPAGCFFACACRALHLGPPPRTRDEGGEVLIRRQGRRTDRGGMPALHEYSASQRSVAGGSNCDH